MAASHTPNNERFTLLFVGGATAEFSALQCLLRHAPYKVVTAADGVQALDLLQQAAIDAALLDLQAPETNGLELLAKMRQTRPTVRVLMLTGHEGVSAAVQAVKLGAIDFLLKSYAPESLLARIDQLYQIWQLEHENRLLREQLQVQSDAADGLVGNLTPLAPPAGCDIAGDSLEAYELAAIRNALAKCDGHRKKTAAVLGIGEATLYRKLRYYTLH